MNKRKQIELAYLEKRQEILSKRFERLKEHRSGFSDNDREDAYLLLLEAQRDLDIARLELGD